jgi:hypothetical protein
MINNDKKLEEGIQHQGSNQPTLRVVETPDNSKSKKKSKEEIQDERFWKGCPTRSEVSSFVSGIIANELSPVLYSLTINLEAIKSILMDKYDITEEQFSEELQKTMVKLQETASAPEDLETTNPEVDKPE